MPTPCESWPVRLAVTRYSATMPASRASLPPAATTASMARLSGAGLTMRVCATGLVGLDTALVDHLGPAIDLGLHELAEVLRRAGDHVEADLGHALADVGRAQRAHHGVVEPGDDRGRRLCRCGARLPRGHDESGKARLADRRHVCELRMALVGGDRKRA